MSDLPILRYERLPAAFHPWDRRAPDVARDVARLIASASPGSVAEHIGSSSVAGLPGKNIVDLGMETAPGDIPAVTDALLSLGFQRQGGLAPFPPTRPMLVGAVVHDGETFRIHLHVIPPARRELAELRALRDALRDDEALRDAYAAAKRRIVEAAPDGDDNLLYTVRKSDFVEDALYRLGIRRPPADAPAPVAPGATIGILGGGELALMLGLEARAMGYGVVALDPDPGCPAAAIADEIVVGGFDDIDAARRLATASDVVTCVLDRVGLEVAAAVVELAPLRPGLGALRATRDRCAERQFIRDIGEWTAPWREVHGTADARAAADALGYPVRLEVALDGHDGRRQVRIAGPAGVAGAVADLGGDDGRPLLLEREIDQEAELSIVCARDRDGRTLAFPASRNVRDAGMLAETVAPAAVHPLVAADAREIAASVARGLDLVGVLTVGLLQLPGGGMMISELAPRVHDAGHWTIEGAETSQFEQHLRAILGLPLGSVRPRGVAATVSLPGTGPDRAARLAGVERALEDPGAHLHVYGRRRVSGQRKMGHVTVVGTDVDDVSERARRARAALHWED